MELIFVLFIVFETIYLPIIFIDWILRKTEVIKVKQLHKSFNLVDDILKPLGYTSDFYFNERDLVCVLKVRQKLNEAYDNFDYVACTAEIQCNITINTTLEEICIDDLKNATSLK